MSGLGDPDANQPVTAMSAHADVRHGARPASAPARARRLDPAELAWAALAPCALATVAAIVLLGPPLGHLLFPPSGDRLWPAGWWEAAGRAEPTKQARYLIAILAPLPLLAAILLGPGRIALRPPIIRALTLAGQATLVALLAVALLEQHPLAVLGFPIPALVGPGRLLPAAAIVLAGLLALRSERLRPRLLALGRETRRRRRAAAALAVALVACWMLEAPVTDRLAEGTIGLSGTWSLNDAMAILGGRTPLVDFHPIYAKLLPYPTALVLSIFGTNTFVYTTFMAVLAGLALLAVYAIFRTVAGGSLPALALFVPFVAMTDVEADAGFHSLSLPPLWPMRFGGTYLLAWLVVRQLAGRRPRSTWAVFFAAGLLVLNSPEFGMAAAIATAAALTIAQPPRSARAAGRLAAHAALGALGAIALVALLTLVRAGELPHPGLLLEWPRIFTSLGWFSLPLRALDLHLAIYATFVAAVALAAVRLAGREEDRVLTGMLMWSGVFGLLVGGYYVGRPDVIKLTSLFSPWSFALSFLTVAVVAGLRERAWRPTLAGLLVLLGFGVSICTLTGAPQPQQELARLRGPGSEPRYLPAAERFVRRHVEPDETVAILLPMSYRISYDLRLRNVTPYGFMNAVVTRRQMQTLLDTLRREQVAAVFTPAPDSFLAHEADAAPEQLEALAEAGYEAVETRGGMVAFRRS